MSLKAFHLLFISASVILALSLCVWCLPDHRGYAGLSLAVAIALVVYEFWFVRKARGLP